ncbi:MAG: hypothetical protein Q9227_006127 [Pyrenula ochraceoflavens]
MSSDPERDLELRPLKMKSIDGAFSQPTKPSAFTLFRSRAKYARLGSGNVTQQKPAFRGWRKSVVAVTCIAWAVLLINLTFGLIATTRLNTQGGLRTIYEGDCDVVSRSDTVLHLFINLLGVLLLGASNYTMQCLNSPTRKETDSAHAQYKSLDIGISSLANLKYLRPWKVVLWFLLCLSSLPLHLFWNSTIFSTKFSNFFDLVIASPDFLEDSNLTVPNVTCGDSSHEDITSLTSRVHDGYRANNYTRLTPSQCFHDYTGKNLFNRRNLILVVSPQKGVNFSGCFDSGLQISQEGSSVIGSSTNNVPGTEWWAINGWVQNSTLLLESIEGQLAENGTWHFGGLEIEECYSETRGAAHCQLQIALPLIWVVVACNIVKVMCLSLTAYFLWDLNEPIFATTGDAVASFIECQDPYTEGHCLMDRVSLGRGEWRTPPETRQDKRYNRKPVKRLYSATSALRYWTSMGFCCAYFIAGIVLLTQISSEFEGLLDAFGTKNTDNQLGRDGQSTKGTIINALISNSFQLALSATYFVYNSLYTAQCGATEWSKFASPELRTLRLTYPRGQQRSTYYLQLPWRFAIPLTSALALMHFLISQSIFLVRLQYRDGQGNLMRDRGILDIGCSASATLTTVCVGAAMILTQLINATRKLENHMPIHGNRSAVISAMCCLATKGHPSDEADSGISLKPLMWGVTQQPRNVQDPFASNTGYSIDQNNASGHCSFTDQTVPLPELGNAYE